MANEPRYVRNRTAQPVFIKGHGVVPAGWEGNVQPNDSVSGLVGVNVLADVKPPALTSKQEAAKEAADLGIEVGSYDSVTEADIRELIAAHQNPEGGER